MKRALLSSIVLGAFALVTGCDSGTATSTSVDKVSTPEGSAKVTTEKKVETSGNAAAPTTGDVAKPAEAPK